MSGWVPNRSEPGPRRIGEALDRVTRSLGMPAVDTLGAVFGKWAEIVGDQVAEHARPVSLRGSTLVVGVDQPGWATQLKYLEADLIRRLAAVAGAEAVERIEVRVRPSP